MAESCSAESVSAVCLSLVPCPTERTMPQLQANKPELRSPLGCLSHPEERHAGTPYVGDTLALENAWGPTSDRAHGPC